MLCKLNMITQIQIQIVPDGGLSEGDLAAFVARAAEEGVTPEELVARLIRGAIAAEPETKEAA